MIEEYFEKLYRIGLPISKRQIFRLVWKLSKHPYSVNISAMINLITLDNSYYFKTITNDIKIIDNWMESDCSMIQKIKKN